MYGEWHFRGLRCGRIGGSTGIDDIGDPALRKYRLRFYPALTVTRTGNLEADIATSTQLFTKVIEDLSAIPDQWLWVHGGGEQRQPAHNLRSISVSALKISYWLAWPSGTAFTRSRSGLRTVKRT